MMLEPAVSRPGVALVPISPRFNDPFEALLVIATLPAAFPLVVGE